MQNFGKIIKNRSPLIFNPCASIKEAEDDAKNSSKIAEIEEKIKSLKPLENSNARNGSAGKDQLVLNPDPDQPVFNPHPLYPALSDAIKILYTTERGRYAVAARDIQVKCFQILTEPLM